MRTSTRVIHFITVMDAQTAKYFRDLREPLEEDTCALFVAHVALVMQCPIAIDLNRADIGPSMR